MIAPRKPKLWGRVKQASAILFNRAHPYNAAKSTRYRGRRVATQPEPEHVALDYNARQKVIASWPRFVACVRRTWLAPA